MCTVAWLADSDDIAAFPDDDDDDDAAGDDDDDDDDDNDAQLGQPGKGIRIRSPLIRFFDAEILEQILGDCCGVSCIGGDCCCEQNFLVACRSPLQCTDKV